METINPISLNNLALAFVPVLGVLALLYFWSKNLGEAVYGFARMLIQLLVIGYFLTYLFSSENSLMISAVLGVMLLVSSAIALRTTKIPFWKLYFISFLSILLGGGFTLFIITQGVLNIDPWFTPRALIPLAGMIFSGSMTAISLAIERLETELETGKDYIEARNIAFRTALIPITNSLFAVGLVSLPGMMTGQILSGVDPLIAVRYQIMVMCMLFAASGLSAGLFLKFVKNTLSRP